MCFSPTCCSRFYAIWCILFGFVYVGTSSNYLYGKVKRYQLYEKSKKIAEENKEIGFPDAFPHLVIGIGSACVLVLISFLYIVAGILLSIGMIWGNERVFQTGKILSYFAPTINFVFIVPLAVHILAVIKISEYRRTRWNP